jgi:hypothetical protein
VRLVGVWRRSAGQSAAGHVRISVDECPVAVGISDHKPDPDTQPKQYPG